MPLDIAKFNSAYADARDRVDAGDANVAAEQARLRALIPDDAAPEDIDWAAGLVDSLAEPSPPPRQWSPLYYEAGEVHAAAYVAEGTTEEKIAALAEARRRIWEIADRASPDEEADIRAMTRGLEHLENELRAPAWPR